MGLNDIDIWLRLNNFTTRLVLLDTAGSLYKAHAKELIAILRYLKKGYSILNKKNPLTHSELPVCMLQSIRLAYGHDEKYAHFYDYYDLST